MKRILRLIVFAFVFSSAINLICTNILPTAVFAAEPDGGINIAALESSPLTLDRIVYNAFNEIGETVSFTPVEYDIQPGQLDGMITYHPDFANRHHSFYQIPSILDTVNLYAYTRPDCPVVNTLEELSNLKVGCMIQHTLIPSLLPQNAEVIRKQNAKQLMTGLLNGEYGAALALLHSGEAPHYQADAVHGRSLAAFDEYLYLRQEWRPLAESLTAAVEQIKTLSGVDSKQIPSAKQTILHIVSSDLSDQREADFTAALQDSYIGSDDLEWQSLSLNAKRFPVDTQRAGFFARILRKDFLLRDTAAIIVSGDEALRFLEDLYIPYFQDVPVIFYGVDYHTNRTLDFFKSYASGIVTQLSAYETVEAALDMFPETQNVYIVNDYTYEGINYQNAIREQLTPFMDSLSITYNSDLPLQEMLAEIQSLPDDTVVLVGSYHTDINGQFFTQEELGKYISQNCTVPYFTLYSSNFTYGGIGGKAPNYKRYAKEAGAMLNKILSGESIASQPVIYDSTYLNQWVFDRAVMNRMKIIFSDISNDVNFISSKPNLFFDHPLLTTGSISAVIMLLAVLIILALTYSQLKKKEKTLQNTLQKFNKALALQSSVDRLENLRSNMQSLLDTLPAPIFVLMHETQLITYANRAFCGLFEISPIAEGQELSIYTLQAPDYPINIDLFKPTGLKTFPLILITRGGRQFEAQITAKNIDYLDKRSSLNVLKDLTAEIAHENMLRATAEKEKEAGKLKSRFLINMSHEIRTPMNAIIGLTEIELRKNTGREVSGAYKKINYAAKNLLNIVNNVLDMTSIDDDKMVIHNKEFELEDVVNNAVSVAMPQLDNKPVECLIKISPDTPRFMVGDENRLWQTMMNFLENAAKHTEKGRVTLVIDTDENLSNEDSVRVNFVVKDTGTGISEDIQRYILTSYNDVYANAQSRYSDIGMGTVVSRRLIELMDGTLSIDSSPDTGTTVFYSLPFKRAAARDTQRDNLAAPILAGKRVLVVDDDACAVEIMLGLLSNAQAEPVSAGSGAEALKTIFDCRDAGKAFNLVLIDYMMEGLNGLETAAQLNISLSAAPKLLMATAHQMDLIRQDIGGGGFAGIIEKPFTPSRFIRQICEVLGANADGAPLTHKESLPRFTGARVLLCEDNLLNQEVAIGLLAQFGIKPEIASDGDKALEVLAGRPVDLVLMDIHMPHMDGYETTRVLRAHPLYKDVPIVSLTADALSEIAENCAAAGIIDNLSKPIEISDLRHMLWKWMPEHTRRGMSPAEETNKDYQEESFMFIDGIAYAEGVTRFGGITEVYEKTLLAYAKTMPEWPPFEEIDIQAMRQEVHQLKGVSGNLGVTEMFRLTVEFEKSLKINQPDERLYKQMVDVSQRVKNDIIEKIVLPEAAPKEAGSAEEFNQLMNNLREALQDFDPIACGENAESLMAKIWPGVDPEAVKQIVELAGAYEFDEALSVLENLQGAQ